MFNPTSITLPSILWPCFKSLLYDPVIDSLLFGDPVGGAMCDLCGGLIDDLVWRVFCGLALPWHCGEFYIDLWHRCSATRPFFFIYVQCLLVKWIDNKRITLVRVHRNWMKAIVCSFILWLVCVCLCVLFYWQICLLFLFFFCCLPDFFFFFFFFFFFYYNDYQFLFFLFYLITSSRHLYFACVLFFFFCLFVST